MDGCCPSLSAYQLSTNHALHGYGTLANWFISYTYIHISHAYIHISHTYIHISHTYIHFSHTYIHFSHTYIHISHTYIHMSHTNIHISHTYIHARKPWCISHTYTHIQKRHTAYNQNWNIQKGMHSNTRINTHPQTLVHAVICLCRHGYSTPSLRSTWDQLLLTICAGMGTVRQVWNAERAGGPGSAVLWASCGGARGRCTDCESCCTEICVSSCVCVCVFVCSVCVCVCVCMCVCARACV